MNAEIHEADIPFISPLEFPTMGLPKPNTLLTVDEYLAFERPSLDRHVYLDGEIFAMAGESEAHGDITVNLVISLGTQLKDKPCRARTKDTKVRSGPIPMLGTSRRGMFSYPDIVVICGEREFHDAERDIILNPTVIIEVLSQSTEKLDRGDKFERFKTYNPTLRDYLLVSQDRPEIEHYTSQADSRWTFDRVTGLEANVIVDSIDCVLKLADVYDRVEFPPAESST